MKLKLRFFNAACPIPSTLKSVQPSWRKMVAAASADSAVDSQSLASEPFAWLRELQCLRRLFVRERSKFSELLLDEPLSPDDAATSPMQLTELGSVAKSSSMLSLAILLMGWMSPQYAQKLGAFHIHELLAKTPVITALVVQSSWSLHLGMQCVHFIKTFFQDELHSEVWNLDIVIAMLLEALVARRVPSAVALVGGGITLLGAWLTTDTGNSFSGCALCLAATTLYSLVAIVISSLDCKVTELLALEGIYSLLVIAALGLLESWNGGTLSEGNFDTKLSGESAKSFIFLCMNDLMLNLGWLWCSKLMGASQTAMLACLSIPLSLLLDAILLGSIPSIPEALVGPHDFTDLDAMEKEPNDIILIYIDIY
eukprot:Skav212614  [mRNA]  locus=scaffold2176:292116:296336:- [translate_table: standard]